MSSFMQDFSTPTDERRIFNSKVTEREYFEQSWKRDANIARDDERAEEERRIRLNRFFKITIFILLGVLVIQIGFNFIIEPRLMINSIKIQVEEGMPLSNETIMRLAGLEGNLKYFDVDTEKAETLLSRVPLIVDAKVSKVFPNTLKIELVRRKPLGVSFFEGEYGDVPLVFDREGVVFDTGTSNLLSDLPVISGIKFPEPVPGIRLPDALIVFIQDLEQLKIDSPLLFGLISELKFVKKNTNDYEVLLYPREYRTRVRIGTRIDADLMKNILLVLDVIGDEEIAPKLEELDFRSNKIVYRIREE
ncbi:MAG: FtsQ-type POTRA domain-containing protein [Spirochaetales bacterium]|nr:FtsQ-type POTRA domain-containing protein [Spirochaetales bacterium]